MNNETILTIDGGDAVVLEFSGDPFVALDTGITQTGENDYNYLKNKPSINGHTIIGDKLGEDYELQDKMNEISPQEIDDIIYL